jgi:hypothetical protein
MNVSAFDVFYLPSPVKKECTMSMNAMLPGLTNI